MIVVQRDFTVQIGPALMTFGAGRVIDDDVLAKALLEGGNPVLEVAGREDLVTCPHCRRAFTLKAAVAAELSVTDKL